MTVDGKDIEVVTKLVFLRALVTKNGLCEKEVRRSIAMEKAAMRGLTSIGKERGVTLESGHQGEIRENVGVPGCYIRSGDLDNEKT